MESPPAMIAIELPSALQEGYELRRPGMRNACKAPCCNKTTISPPLSTARREPSGETAGLRDGSGRPSVTRCWIEIVSTTRNASLRPRLNAEKTIESPSGDQLMTEFG